MQYLNKNRFAMKRSFVFALVALLFALLTLPVHAVMYRTFEPDVLLESPDSLAIADSTDEQETELFYMRLLQVRYDEGEWERVTGLMTYDPDGEALIEIGEQRIYVFFDVSSEELIETDPELWDYYGTIFSEGTAQSCVVIWGHTETGSYLKVIWPDEDDNDVVLEFTAEDIY